MNPSLKNLNENVQVQIWRRSFDVPPPDMTEDHPYYANIAKDERYNTTLIMENLTITFNLDDAEHENKKENRGE